MAADSAQSPGAERVSVPDSWAVVCNDVSTVGDTLCPFVAGGAHAVAPAPASLTSGMSGLDSTHPLSKPVAEGNGSRPPTVGAVPMLLAAENSSHGTASKPTMLLAGALDIDAAEKGGHGSGKDSSMKGKVSSPLGSRVQ